MRVGFPAVSRQRREAAAGAVLAAPPHRGRGSSDGTATHRHSRRGGRGTDVRWQFSCAPRSHRRSSAGRSIARGPLCCSCLSLRPLGLQNSGSLSVDGDCGLPTFLLLRVRGMACCPASVALRWTPLIDQATSFMPRRANVEGVARLREQVTLPYVRGY
jgi:hypothetical protein